MMLRKNLHLDGAGAVGSGGSSTTPPATDPTATDQTPPVTPPAEDSTTPATPTDPTEQATTTAAAPAESDSDVNAYDYGNDDTSDEPVTADPATTADAPTAEVRDSRRDELMKRFQAAQKYGQTAAKTNNAEGMQSTAAQVMEVIKEAQEPVDQFKNDAPQDQKAKKEQAQYLKLVNDATIYLKSYRSIIQQKATQKGLTPDFKQALKAITKETNEFLSRKAARDQTKMDDFFRSAGKGLSQLTKMKHEANHLAKTTKKGADAKTSEVETKELTPEEKAGYLAEAEETGFDGVAGEAPLDNGDRKEVKKSIKELQKAEEAKEFAKTKGAEKSEGEKSADESKQAQEAISDNGVPTPDKQQVRASVVALREAGKLSKEAADNLLKKLADKVAVTMKTGADVLTAKTDDDEHRATFSFNEAREKVFGSIEGDGDSAELSEDLALFRNTAVGMHVALSRGTSRQFKPASGLQVTSEVAYNGETIEGGQLAFSQLTQNGASSFVADDETPSGYVTHWKKVQQQLEESGDVLAGRMQATDPEAVV